jgi:hypothetical protein
VDGQREREREREISRRKEGRKEGRATLCWLMMLMSDLFSLSASESKTKARGNTILQLFSIILVEKKKFSVDETITAFSPKMQVLRRNLIIGF